MAALALIISIIALILAFMAYQKVGGLGDVSKQAEVLTQIGDAIVQATNSLKEKTIELLEKLEVSLKGKDTSKKTPHKQEERSNKIEG